MSRQVKVAMDLTNVDKSVNRVNGQRCLTHCPVMMRRNNAGVTWRQVAFCPITARRLSHSSACCIYGKRLIASAVVRRAQRKKQHGSPKD